MKRYLIACDRVKKDCIEMFNEINTILTDTFGQEGKYKIYTTTEYGELEDEKRDEVWENLRLLCLHTDTPESDLVSDAFQDGIPVILVRGENLSTPWVRRLQKMGALNKTRKDLDSAKNRVFFVEELEDIRGAVKWINHYYHGLAEQVMEKKVSEFHKDYIAYISNPK